MNDKRTLLEVDLTSLQDYQNWKSANEDWNISSYIHLKYSLNAALAFSKLFFPTFIIRQGCIVLEFLYDSSTFDSWFNHFKGDIRSIEFKCNFFEVRDYFNLENEPFDSDDQFALAEKELANALKKSWELNLNNLFPDRKMIVDVWHEYDSMRISLFSDGDKKDD